MTLWSTPFNDNDKRIKYRFLHNSWQEVKNVSEKQNNNITQFETSSTEKN